MDNNKILVHVCCAPCATSSCQRLVDENQKIVLFFSNSNIYPYEEYKKRLQSVEKLAQILKAELIKDDYYHDQWLEQVKGLENQPEKGKRCHQCFEYSLKRTGLKAGQLLIPHFTTTLTVSPHKKSNDIFNIGQNINGYIAYDFKKKNGFANSIKLSQEYKLYRQNYCGCEFSLKSKNRVVSSYNKY